MSEINEKLIEEVRKHDCIYNLQSDLYKNFYYKQDLWIEIGEVVGITGDEAKKKWKVIRDSYKRYKLRENQPSGSECAFSKPYKYAESLRFLDDVTSKRKTICNVAECTTSDTAQEDADCYSTPTPKRKKAMQESFETFLSAATTSMANINEKVKSNATAHMFESLAKKINESGLSKQQVNEIECVVCSVVYAKIAEFTE